MTRPHPVGGKARTRKPETRSVDRVYRLALAEVRFWEKQADNRFYDLRALLSELRRSLRDARGSK